MRILVVNGTDSQLVTAKINAIHSKHGPFDVCLSLCPLDDKPEVPTYHQGNLPQNGALQTKDGLTIAYASTPIEVQDQIDILITRDWPADIGHNSLKAAHYEGSVAVKEIAMQLKPRYHFAAGQHFYEREPYSHDGVVTRFIALAEAGNADKQKWFYAMNLDPGSVESSSMATASPYLDLKRKTEEDQIRRPPAGYVCVRCKIEGHYIRNCPQQVESKPKAEQCWFCLSNPQVAKHLIVSVADHTYLTLPKGPLVEGHVLIVPITHIVSQKELQDDDTRQEIDKLKATLVSYYKSLDQVPVFFETSFRALHLTVQCIPIPSNKVKDARELFMSELQSLQGKDAKFQKYSLKTLQKHDHYLYVELANDDKLIYPIKSKSFDVSFARGVLARLLNKLDRIDWKSCLSDELFEKKDAAKFIQSFKEYS